MYAYLMGARPRLKIPLGAGGHWRAGIGERPLHPAVARLTTVVVTSYLSSGASPRIDPRGLVELVKRVSATAANLAAIRDGSAPRPDASAIAHSIKCSALISFEDGRPYKRLPRHLAARGLTPGDYRRKWGLPDDYPMVCAEYSAACSARRRRGRGAPARPRLMKSEP